MPSRVSRWTIGAAGPGVGRFQRLRRGSFRLRPDQLRFLPQHGTCIQKLAAQVYLRRADEGAEAAADTEIYPEALHLLDPPRADLAVVADADQPAGGEQQCLEELASALFQHSLPGIDEDDRQVGEVRARMHLAGTALTPAFAVTLSAPVELSLRGDADLRALTPRFDVAIAGERIAWPLGDPAAHSAEQLALHVKGSPDDYRVELPEGNIIKETYIGRAIAEADADAQRS